MISCAKALVRRLRFDTTPPLGVKPEKSFDALPKLPVARIYIAFVVMLFCPLVSVAAETSLAIINAGISSSEDSPFISTDFHFQPGDYVYFTFEISGFAIHSQDRGEIKSIAVEFQSVPEDEHGRALTAPVSGEIKVDLSPEDKNWVPKRRASFLLPSFLAASQFHVHVSAKDLFAKTEAAEDVPFSVGGIHLRSADSLTVQNFRFLRREDDTEPLSIPAYSPGDTVFARFEITGFRNGEKNDHHVAYGVKVLGPDGKPFVQDPNAADLEKQSFYPAQFIPGAIALNIDAKSPHGEYVVILMVRDLLSNEQYETKQAFSIE